ncbi:MAG: hypothetical protein AAF615_06610 [Pseudomonadota bacterium]
MRFFPLAIVCLVATPALAFDPTGNPAADALLKAFEDGDDRIVSVGNVNATGDTIVVTGIEARRDGGPDGPATIKIGSVEVSAPNLSGDVLMADRVLIQDRSEETAAGTWSVAEEDIRDARLAAGSLSTDADVSQALAAYGRATASGFKANVKPQNGSGSATFAVETAGWLPSQRGETGTVAGELTLTGVSVESQDIPPMPVSPGPANLTLSFAYTEASGALDLSDMTLTVPNVGELAIVADIDGATSDNVKALTTASGIPSPGVLTGVAIGGLSVSFTDDGALNAALQNAGAGMSPDTVRAMALQGLSGALLAIGNQQLANEIQSAASAFLNGTAKTVTISAAPAKPTTLAEIIGAAQRSPGALISLLNPSVSSK